MVLCPNCLTENRSGAKFCKNCAAPLPITQAATRPLGEESVTRMLPTDSQPVMIQPANLSSSGRTHTKPLTAAQPFARRAPGAIFADAFLYKSQLYSDDRQNRYLVTHLEGDENHQVQVCPNPACGAIFSPFQCEPQKFCTDCGTPIGNPLKEFVLVETPSPLPENVTQLARKCLAHKALRVPLNTYVEMVSGKPRYCMILPQSSALEKKPDTRQALTWGVYLARGLDYLHDNGVSFNGQVKEDQIGMVGDHPVWADFTRSIIYPEGYIQERAGDIHALAALIYFWVSGKTRFESDTNVLPAIQKVFEDALTGSGYASAGELATALEGALEVFTSPQEIDFQIGKRTHVGMVRSLNEDSLLTLEINRVQQSISQPLALLVVADGMGGHAAGEIASGAIVNSIAQKALQELIPSQLRKGEKEDRKDWLKLAVEFANREVFELRKTAGTDMGSTLVAAVLDGNVASIAHVGDSRAYVINAQGIRQVTTDHSLVERLIATNQISRDEARYHPQRNVIYRTVGDKAKVEVEVSSHKLAIGDVLLLCSDGMSGMLEDKQIHQIVISASSPQQACEELIRAANAAGGDDNITVIIAKVVRP